MLENLVVSIDKREKCAIQYIKDKLSCQNIEYHLDLNKLRATFRFNNECDVAKDIIAEVIIYFYKFKEIYKELQKCPLQNMCFYAYIGALLSIDYDQEKTQILENIEEVGDVVSIDGFYNFCNNQLYENWKNLAQLSYKLYSQCKTEEDAFELTTFMLGVDGEGEAVIVIDNHNSIRLIKNKKHIPIIKIFEKEEFNIIATVLSHRPTNIIVVNPDKIEPALMQAIHSLGD